MLFSFGEDVFREAQASGTVTIDLGWRTIRLNSTFFQSLGAVDILGELASFQGSLLAIAGRKDRLAVHLPRFVEHSSANQKITILVDSADHIFNILGPGQSRASEVIAATVDWFSRTL